MVLIGDSGLVTKANYKETCWLVWYMPYKEICQLVWYTPYKEKVKNRGLQVTLALGDTMDGDRINIVSEHYGGEEVEEYHPPRIAENTE